MTLKTLLTAFCLLFCASWAHAQTDCPPTSWLRFISPGDQQYEVVERLDLGQGREIAGITFGALEGEFSKVHMFIEFVDGCFNRAVSLGSYAYLRELSEDPPPFHLDLYTLDAHSTLGWYEGTPPSYAEIRALATRQLGDF